MKDEIMVSICCATYNQEQYIKDALESFVNQKTNFKYEVIVQDDASTDNTSKIVKEYELKYPEIIKPIYQKENQYSQGRGVFQIIFDAAKGKYIAICEGDDYWIDPLKLQKQVDYMEKNKECSFVFHNAEIIDVGTGEKELFVPCSNEAKINMTSDGNYNVGQLEKIGFIPTASFMFRRENLKKSPDWMLTSIVGDVPIKLIMTSFGYAHFIDEKMSVYRKNSTSSITVVNHSNAKKSVEDSKIYFNKLKKIVQNIDEFTNLKYHEIFLEKINEIEINHYININKKFEIIKKGLLKKFNFKKKIKYIIRIFMPKIYQIIINKKKNKRIKNYNE